MVPNEAAERAVRSALVEHRYIEEIGDEFEPGLMGEQIEAVVTDTTNALFRLSVTDFDLNAEFSVVHIESGRYNNDFDTDGDEVIVTFEVRRWPDV